MNLTASLSLIAPELVLSASSLILLLMAAWMGDRHTQTISWLAALALAAATILAVPALSGGASGLSSEAFGGQFRADAYAAFAKILIYIAAIASILVAPAFFERLRAMRAEYPVLIVLATIGMSIMVSANDLMTLYIGLELNSLASYVLAAFLRNETRSAEAGLKYFVLGALASGILLFGMSLLYGFTGTTNFAGIESALGGGAQTGALFGLIFVLAGLAFKISAVPFHMWTPDVYEGAPTPVTLFFASAPKVAAVALTARVALEAFDGQVEAWRQIVVFAALASIVVGALGAIGQTNLKRLLAYSSINNVGFLLIGLAAASLAGVAAMLAYLVVYVAMTLGSFVALLLLQDRTGEPLETLGDIAGLSSRSPGVAWSLLVLMFSLAGIPPLMGFWAKFVVFRAAVEADLLLLAVIGIAASVIGAFYYIKVVKVMFFDEPADREVAAAGGVNWAILIAAVLFISPLGYLLTGWLGTLANTAASALFIAA